MTAVIRWNERIADVEPHARSEPRDPGPDAPEPRSLHGAAAAGTERYQPERCYQAGTEAAQLFRLLIVARLQLGKLDLGAELDLLQHVAKIGGGYSGGGVAGEPGELAELVPADPA